MKIENIDKLVVYKLNGKNYIGFASEHAAKVSLALGYKFQNIIPLQKAIENADNFALRDKNEIVAKLREIINDY